MRTTGRRTLAGIAAGALAFAGLAFVATPSAQAAQTTAVYCAEGGSPGNGGTPFDPSTVQPNCIVPAGPAQTVTFDVSDYPAAGAEAYVLQVSGASTFVDTDTSPNADLAISSDGKTAVVLTATGWTELVMTVPTPGVRTVSITGGPDSLIQNQRDLGTLTVTGTGASSQAIVSQGYYAVDAASGDDSVPLAIVHVVDADGDVLDLSAAGRSNVTYNTSGGGIVLGTYQDGDCSAVGTLTSSGAVDDAGETAGSGIITDACATTVGAGVDTVTGSGVWVTWDSNGAGLNAPGSYTATFTLTVGANTYPVSVNYVVSSTVAGGFTAALDKAQYDKGAVAEIDVCATDLGGRIVPDGLGWASLGDYSSDDTAGRQVVASTNSPIFDPITGGVVAPTTLFAYANGSGDDTFGQVGTYNGCANAAFIVPPTAMDNFRFTVTSLVSNGWASVATGVTKASTARIGDPVPVTQSIMIEGTRGVGSDANRVYVEGTTEGLVGKSVTPFFRFPGETGFTAGTGTRTVDAEGNFAWQRKTGKKIAVQFRGEGVVSNTIIIEAK